MAAKIPKRSPRMRISPRQLLEDASVSVGAQVSVGVRDGAVRVTPLRRLSDLIRRTPESHEVSEVDWGRVAGREVW